MIESIFVETSKKNDKNMMAGCIHQDPEETVSNFLDNHLLPLLGKLSHENKQVF